MNRLGVVGLSAAIAAAVGLCGCASMGHSDLDGHGRAGMRPLSVGEGHKSVPVQAGVALLPRTVTFRDLPVIAAATPGAMSQISKRDRDPDAESETRERSPISEAEADSRRAAALAQPVRPLHVQRLEESTKTRRQPSAPSTDVVNLLGGFEGPDISQCCGNSASVPPDTHMAAGLNHVIATVNSAIGIYDKQGNLLGGGPVESDTFFNTANCTGTFDPTVEYDEVADRFIINYDASPNDCIAVSQTGDPTGAWNVYSFNSGIDAGGLFDYPHIGVGDQAIYVGANMFFNSSPFAGRVWALNKAQMYAGQALTPPTPHDLVDGGNADGTPTPMVLHGAPSAPGTVYIITDDTNFSGDTFGVWQWTDSTGVAAPTLVGYADLATATGVTANFPIDQTQLGTPVAIQANDVRTLDAEWRNGHLWLTHQMSCNIGAGAQGCARWAEVDPSDASVVQAGVVSIFGKSISFPNLAVDANDNMALGFTVMGPSKRPSVYIAARMSGDAPGTLRDATQVRGGDIIYSAFDGSPGRWGDYSGMTADPDGQHLWYLGEYSKGGMASPYLPNQYGNWGTYIQQIGFGPDDHIFADGFDPVRSGVKLHAEANLDDADSAPGVAVTTGDPVQLRFVVINTGAQRLNSVLVTDQQLGVVTCPANTLDAGADMICDVNSTAVSGLYSSSATASAVAQDGTPVSDTNAANYTGFNPLPGTKCTSAGGAGCPRALADNGTVTSSFTVSGCTTIDDVNVGLSIDHTYVGDLYITLTDPASTTVRLLNSPVNGNDSCSGNNVRALLDDASTGPVIDSQCATTVPALYGSFKPSLALSGFNGQAGNGTWTLTVQDVYPQDTGTLNDWSLQLTCH